MSSGFGDRKNDVVTCAGPRIRSGRCRRACLQNCSTTVDVEIVQNKFMDWTGLGPENGTIFNSDVSVLAI